MAARAPKIVLGVPFHGGGRAGVSSRDDADHGVMIAYSDPESISAKTAYASELGVGGVMSCALSGDRSEHALLAAIDEDCSACPGR